MAQGIRIETNFRDVVRGAKEFDRALGNHLRKRIRDAAKPIAEKVKAEVRKPPRGGGKGESTGLREGIAAGVGVRITTGSRSAGVTIAATPNRLPTNQRAMVKAYNKDAFRHPVFGNRSAWAVQLGRPYFGSVIYDELPEVRKEVQAALEDAAQEIAKATGRG